MLIELEHLVRERTAFVRGIPFDHAHVNSDEERSQLNAAMGAQQWQYRIQAIFVATTPTLNLQEAVLAFTSALAHFAAADGREWSA